MKLYCWMFALYSSITSKSSNPAHHLNEIENVIMSTRASSFSA